LSEEDALSSIAFPAEKHKLQEVEFYDGVVRKGRHRIHGSFYVESLFLSGKGK
jgi:hypothetical protein